MRGEDMGKVEVIAGSMFSGKTEELIRRLIRAEIARQTVIVFKPKIDTRYSEHHIVSHDVSKLPCIAIDHADEILPNVGEATVIGVDEAQFFDDTIIDVANQLAALGKRVIVAGCEMYSSGEPFGPMGGLMCVAEEVEKLHAVCMVCGEEAYISYRKARPQNGNILIGYGDIYEARCRQCAALGDAVHGAED
ncbi:thymidine kinase [candidate division KSB3 bacterium]|uniref:Thymidine kinase n=1 Tax=candidate division KSB3 bacterium TaxID=2044937 RepID=A0A9D5Q5F3_9BACT|nr:thymidine kinase [candidate division KSB3 bacterium]MBD3324268.1 thymidine kinase [candidate division KSB3 bacterium]